MPQIVRKNTARKVLSPARRRGGKEWQPFRDRLEQLVRCAGSPAAFARACGITPTMLNSWRFGRALPGSMQLRGIARASGVTLDWLLEGDNQAGEKSDLPVYRKQSRSTVELEDDFAACVERGLSAHPQLRVLGIGDDAFEVDGSSLMKRVVDAEAERIATKILADNASYEIFRRSTEVLQDELRDLSMCFATFFDHSDQIEIGRRIDAVNRYAYEHFGRDNPFSFGDIHLTEVGFDSIIVNGPDEIATVSGNWHEMLAKKGISIDTFGEVCLRWSGSELAKVAEAMKRGETVNAEDAQKVLMLQQFVRREYGKLDEKLEPPIG